MGCNVSTIRLDPKKVKTEAQVRKAFAQRCEDDRHEFGNDPYSGAWNTLYNLRITSLEFDTLEQADNALSERIQKHDAIAARIKVFTEGKRITDAREACRVAADLCWRTPQGTPEHKKAKKVWKKAIDKLKRLELAAAQRSKKFAWVICAACAE